MFTQYFYQLPNNNYLSRMLKNGPLFIIWICICCSLQTLEAQPWHGATALQHAPQDAFNQHAVAVKFLPNANINEYSSYPFDNQAIDAIMTRLGIIKTTPLFQNSFRLARGSKQFVAIQNMHSAQLHQWHIIHLPRNLSIQKAIQTLQAIELVDIVEPIVAYSLTDAPNDPLYNQQWHYNNTGQAGGTPGVDIGMEQAWTIETGKPNVLVSIHDGGVDTAHADLKQNLWQGVGYNFVNPGAALNADGHGTHVAGTVAATRNNNIGVSGVAGGDGSPQSGVRYMSLQIVGGGSGSAGSEAEAYIFAANNGAAVSQNSWSYNAPNLFPTYTQNAIDYFIKNGGGTVMQGGIVFFSAGNYASNQTYYPGAYQAVVAVAATNNKDILPYYSSYGNWVDISAPGGEQTSAGGGQSGGVFSTEPGNAYGFRQGTSMACPHVSGVAALLISHAPNKLLPNDIKYILQSTSINVNALNQTLYQNQMGAGRLSASAAMTKLQQISSKPSLPKVTNASIAASAICGTVTLQYTNNSPENEIVIVENTTGEIGFIGGIWPTVGKQVPGGGTIVYVGNSNSIQRPLSLDGSIMRYNIYTFSAADTNYAVGVPLSYITPSSIQLITATPFTNAIDLDWQKQCPNNPILLVFNTELAFGTPTGNPNSITTITGGGTRLLNGQATSFLHNNLLADKQYYYALYPYVEQNGVYTYGAANIVASGTLCGIGSLPITQSFASLTMPPTGWRLTDGGPQNSTTPDNRTWRSLQGFSSDGDNAAAVLPNYLENGNNSKEILRSPGFIRGAEVDTLIVSFDYAYQAYSNAADLSDSLELAISFDCGATLQTIWKAGGSALATVPNFNTGEFLPENADAWKSMTFDISNRMNSGQQATIIWRGTNKFGQNIWLDNLKIIEKKASYTDISIAKNATTPYYCTASAKASLLITNTGTLAVDTIAIAVKNGNTINQQIFRNLALAPAASTLLSVDVNNMNIGSNTLTIYQSLPDTYPNNDTIAYNILVSGSSTIPFTQNFTNLTDTLPAQWLTLRNGAPKWIANNSIGYGNATGAMQALNYGSIAGRAVLVTPQFTLPTNIDSAFMQYVWAGVHTQDSLQIWLTNNCGQQLQLIQQIATSNPNINWPTNQPFIPNTTTHWAQEKLDLTPYLSLLQSGNFQVQLVFLGKNGNHVYVDDISILTRTIPANLKADGYGVYPNPIGSQFTIWHLTPPTNLGSINIYNAMGQLMYQKQFQANAAQTITIPSNSWSKGIYIIKLQYDGFERQVKVLK